MNYELKLLEYALKGKNFAAELVSQTKYEYFSIETRLPLTIILDYFKSYRQIPSYDVATELAQKFDSANATKIQQTLKIAYTTDKKELIDGDFPYFVSKLKEKYNDEFLRSQVKTLQQSLAENVNISKINECVKKIALEVSSLKDSNVYDCGELKDSAKSRLSQYNERHDNPELARGILSGFKQLDAITNGFRESELILISGATGSGKSVIIMNMAVNAWLGNNAPILNGQEITTKTDFDDSGHNVWFITIENPKNMFERRLDACMAQINSDHIRDGSLTPEEYTRFGKTLAFQYKYSEKKRFYVSDLGRGLTMGRIESEYEKILAFFEPDMVVIDYLGIMSPIEKTGHDWLDQGTIAAEMHEFARAVKKPVITASQMKGSMRTPQGLKQFVGDPESVARSKMISDNVNLNLQIEKPRDFHISQFFNLHVSKNRDGKTGDVITLCKEFYKQRVCDPDDNFLTFRNDMNNFE